ncbi:hypothetical protein C8Q79DRAFT_1020673 [Trametes meyenii]|nr:hypothetical protein C8Q79DRAFT_1020673 [Trametes meyenii]
MPRFFKDTVAGEFVWKNTLEGVCYTILSHTWRSDQEGGEQSFDDVLHLQGEIAEELRKRPPEDIANREERSDAYAHTHISLFSHPALSEEIKGICNVAREASYRLVWIDSCCMDKSNTSERYFQGNQFDVRVTRYREADVCYVCLADVRDGSDPKTASEFRRSRWHQPGWALQELIALRRTVFLTSTWHFLGTKMGLASALESITRVDASILTGASSLDFVGAARRMS